MRTALTAKLLTAIMRCADGIVEKYEGFFHNI